MQMYNLLSKKTKFMLIIFLLISLVFLGCNAPKQDEYVGWREQDTSGGTAKAILFLIGTIVTLVTTLLFFNPTFRRAVQYFFSGNLLMASHHREVTAHQTISFEKDKHAAQLNQTYAQTYDMFRFVLTLLAEQNKQVNDNLERVLSAKIPPYPSRTMPQLPHQNGVENGVTTAVEPFSLTPVVDYGTILTQTDAQIVQETVLDESVKLGTFGTDAIGRTVYLDHRNKPLFSIDLAQLTTESEQVCTTPRRIFAQRCEVCNTPFISTQVAKTCTQKCRKNKQEKEKGGITYE